MKVVGFEEESKSLIVAFASDETASNNPEDYASFAYQPIDMWPGENNAEQLKKNIAITNELQVSLIMQQKCVHILHTRLCCM